MLQVFGIPNCDTVKKARRFLDEHKVAYEFYDFKKGAPSLSQLEKWEEQLGEELVNKRGRTYREIKDALAKISGVERLKLIQKNTSALKRPLIVKEGKVLEKGFNEKQYLDLIKAIK